MKPHPSPVNPFARPADPVAFHTARLDADLERFEAGIKRGTWRFIVASVVGAIGVVTFGVWGFGVETNTRNAPVPPALLSRPAGPAVMMIIRPAAATGATDHP